MIGKAITWDAETILGRQQDRQIMYTCVQAYSQIPSDGFHSITTVSFFVTTKSILISEVG